MLKNIIHSKIVKPFQSVRVDEVLNVRACSSVNPTSSSLMSTCCIRPTSPACVWSSESFTDLVQLSLSFQPDRDGEPLTS